MIVIQVNDINDSLFEIPFTHLATRLLFIISAETMAFCERYAVDLSFVLEQDDRVLIANICNVSAASDFEPNRCIFPSSFPPHEVLGSFPLHEVIGSFPPHGVLE